MIVLLGMAPSVAAAFVVGFVSAFLIARYGFRIGLADVPNERSSHIRPVPRGGGVGIPLAALLAMWAWRGHVDPFLIAALAVSFLAFLTDFHELSVKLRFLIQFALAAALIWLYKYDWLAMMGRHHGVVISLAAAVVLVLFIVAGTNFFNFMDGINGIAGFQGVVSFGFLGFFALYVKGAEDVALLAFAVSAAAIGFLFLNFPRARVFMGDVGSIFLGFLFCALVVLMFADIKEFLVLALFNGLFYVDCVSTVLLRLYRRENVFQAHRKHLYQELVHQSGWPHYKVTLTYAVAQILVGAGTLSLLNSHVLVVGAAWIALFVVYWAARKWFGFFGRV